ncbi:Krr1-domain-containing protein [Daedalea quercina L-15889]|uniref:Krr1-domain-containing protein n=1 Tax=Daedalea quercina L-15889 TaxID=1314783 RepID=A0A165LUZ7_9APHY|nr:Krr1-domain-containing protein [Daedalea quercina L-15889]
MLSDGSDNEETLQFTINEHYAKAYEHRKEREELAKLKEKYGSDVDENGVDEDDSEEAESEDEYGEELTPAVDAAILRTLARIRRKDPAIYESGKDIFEEEWQRTGDAAPVTHVQKDKSKPLTMRQHALASALYPSSRSPSPELLTHAAEQAALRKETISAFHGAVSGPQGSADDDNDDFLVPREKTKDEIEREEEEYRQFLEREVGDDLREIVTLDTGGAGGGEVSGEEAKEEGKEKKKTKKKEDAKAKKSKEEDQEFLMNYILNRGWIDRSARRLPTYKEIVGSKSKRKQTKMKGDAGHDGLSSSASEASEAFEVKSEGESGEENSVDGLDEDEFDEVADRFESSYNFRFEEAGAAEIARYPRNIDSLVRRQDTSRKEAREKRKARKEDELLKKREEVKRLKSLKLKDLQARLEKIGKEGGKSLASKALQELDLDADWDPAAHDRQMAELYERDADVYADADVEEEKPMWDDDIDVADIMPPEEDEDETQASSSKKKKKKKKKQGVQDIDEDGVDIDEMDAAVERQPAEEEEWDGTEDMRKRVLEKYMDELYELEFNDMIGDMPTRFKYTRVAPQNFGLAPAEVLMATDAELNQFMGIKKYAPYRKEGKGRNWDGQRTARLQELRETLKDRGLEPAEGIGRERTEKSKKRKGKKERMREKAMANGANGANGVEEDREDGCEREEVEEAAGRKAKRRKLDEDGGEVDDGLYGINDGNGGQDTTTKKKRRRHKKSHHATVVNGV